MPITGLEPIAKHNLSSRVYLRIRDGLVNGQFEPGERLTIGILAKEMGVSSTPVREAIFRLVSEQALEMKAATAVNVPVITSGNLREISSFANFWKVLQGKRQQSGYPMQNSGNSKGSNQRSLRRQPRIRSEQASTIANFTLQSLPLQECQRFIPSSRRYGSRRDRYYKSFTSRRRGVI